MFTKILAITALSLSLGGAALAQTDSATSGGSNGEAIEDQMPTSWQGTIAGTFFTDETGVTLRTDEEIRTGFASLSAEQQAQVRADCEVVTAQNASGGATTAESSSNVPPETTASVGAASGMTRLCTMVGEM